jgi:phage terminase large subunit GpA-like protein
LLLGTDYDHFPESVDGEGDAYSLMRARARSFMSRGMVVVESSPGAPLTDETWRPKTPHDSPPVKYGVLGLYPQGTRGRWYWPCPECGAEFEPTFRRLDYPDSADPVEAGEAARMKCPHCKELFGHHLKRELNGVGRWQHELTDGKTGGIDHPDIRRTDLLSYWLDGTAAAFASWSELVTQYLNGVKKYEATGDEEALKTAYNTGQAQPYMPRSATSASEVTLQGLKDKAQGLDTPKGVAPDWARYITVSIDVQGTSFSVGVTAWGEFGRHQPIDRFDLIEPPRGAPGGEASDGKQRTLKPFDIAEDWAVLEPLANMRWPVEGGAWELRPLALAIDMHGGGATTENAYRFYRAMRKKGEGRIWFLTRGQGGQFADRVWLKAPERTSKNRRRVAKDVQILNMATDRLKDAVSASLRLVDEGQNHCAIPEWMDDNVLTEYTAERRGVKGWEKRPGMVRNESLDHLVQARALHIHLGGEKIDWAAPRPWAVLSEENTLAIRTGPVPEVDLTETDTSKSAAIKGRNNSWISPRKDWI